MNQVLKSSIIQQGDNLPSVVKHVTQRDINLYAEVSGDFNPIHVDEAFAAQTPLGGTIAHGMLGPYLSRNWELSSSVPNSTKIIRQPKYKVLR